MIRLDKLISVEVGINYIMLPYDMEPEVIEDLQACLIKYQLGYKSIDYAKKVNRKYVNPNASEEHPFVSLIKRILGATEKVVNENASYLKLIPKEVDSNYIAGSLAVLNRLFATYETTFFLIRNGFFSESMVLIRLIFEQLSYCINVIESTPQDFTNKKINYISNKLSPTKIHNIKRIFPEEDLGKEYSLLCNYAHLGYNAIGSYLKLQNGQQIITTVSTKNSIIAGLWLLKMLDLQSVIQEIYYSTYTSKKRLYSKRLNGRLVPKKNRLIKTLRLKFDKEFTQLNKNYFEEVLNVQRTTYFTEEDDDLPF